MAIKLIVGLANPENKYSLTRHNIGALYIKTLSKRLNKKLKINYIFSSYVCECSLKEKLIKLIIPNTFINLNGKIIKKIADFLKIKSKDILIIHDELDLLPGIIKFKIGIKNSHHNGLKGIYKYFKNDNFYRLRIGIGRPLNGSKIKFLLSKPLINEYKLITNVIEESIKYLEILINNDIVTFMNKLHAYKAI